MKRLPINKVTADERLQHRKLSVPYINELLAEVEDGLKLPPLSVIYDGETYWLFDGFHRFNVARILKWTEVECEVYDGDFRAAWEASLGVNDKYGLRRTAADITGILEKVMNDAALCKLSDREIARLVNVGKSTVNRFRLKREEAARAASDNQLSTAGDGGSASGPPSDAARLAKKQSAARQALFALSLAVEELGHFDQLREHLAKIKEIVNP